MTNTKEVWLTYFNQVLFEKGAITEKERNKMNTLIKRTNSVSKNNNSPSHN